MDYLASHAAHGIDTDKVSAELDIAIDGLSSYMADIEETANTLDGLFPPPTDEEVNAFRHHVLSSARTPEWDVVVGRINSGELTWRAIVSGEVDTDRDVDAAMRSTPRVDPSTLTDGSNERLRPPGVRDGPQAGRTQHVDFGDDDEYFHGFTPRG